MSFWTDIRDTAESAAVLAGNYYLPGSSLVTSKLVSEGSQKQLGSTVGQLAQLGFGGYGAMEGNLANYSTAYDKVAGAFGGNAGSQVTGQQAVDAFNSGKISAAEFEALANGSGTTGSSLLSAAKTGGAGLSSYLTPAAILGSSMFGAQAAQKNAATQAEAANQANQLLYSMYQQNVARQEPFYQAGVRSLNAYEKGIQPGGELVRPFTATDYTADPGYAFRLSEGQKALERSAAARGGLLSGGTGKALTRFGQDYASNEYQNAYNRFINQQTTQRNALAGLAGYGPSSASAIGSAGSNYGTAASGNITDAGSATGAGYMGTANAYSGGLNTYLNYNASQNLANAMMENARSSSYKA